MANANPSPSLDAVVANSAANEVPALQVVNPDEPGMGHGKFGWSADDPERFYSVAAERNKAFIGENLKRYLQSLDEGTVLEIGSGSGQHVAYFAEMLPRLSFLPTEYNGHPNPMADPQQAARMLVSIGKTAAAAGVQNVQPAAFLDASDLASWPGVADSSLAAILCINVVHISPEAVLRGVVKGAARKLAPNGLLFFYGAWGVDGVISPESNVRFDAMLRSKNADFGLRDIRDLTALCAQEGCLEIEERLFVEASNNYLLCVRRK